jgi:predicted DCC family thiol-disulfide oxidoreductase YuxK
MPRTIGSKAGVTVWFDGSCPLCAREIALMKRLDKRGVIEFIDVVDSEDVACPVDKAILLARLHAQEDGQLLSGASAFAAMWRAIPILRPLGLLARSQVVLVFLDKAYIKFLKLRPKLQRLVARGVMP